MPSSEAKNLEAICNAIKKHNSTCEFDAVAVAMNPFEVERLGWEDIMGLPIESDSKLSTGRFRIICAGESTQTDEEIVEAISTEKELVTV